MAVVKSRWRESYRAWDFGLPQGRRQGVDGMKTSSSRVFDFFEDVIKEFTRTYSGGKWGVYNHNMFFPLPRIPLFICVFFIFLLSISLSVKRKQLQPLNEHHTHTNTHTQQLSQCAVKYKAALSSLVVPTYLLPCCCVGPSGNTWCTWRQNWRQPQWPGHCAWAATTT